MLVWKQQQVLTHQSRKRAGASAPQAGVPEEMLDVWHTTGGDAMAVISKKKDSYELVAWWVNGGASITPAQNPPAFLSLADAQEEAERLIFQRVDAWARLLEDQ